MFQVSLSDPRLEENKHLTTIYLWLTEKSSGSAPEGSLGCCVFQFIFYCVACQVGGI